MSMASQQQGERQDAVVLPLSGVRVIDLTWHAAGPFGTRRLADYGADVIKIERPGVGDPARDMPPFYKDVPGLERSGLFMYANLGKRSMTLDLKSERGRQIVLDLVKDADVLVESFRPRVMPALGLDYDTLKAVNPPPHDDLHQQLRADRPLSRLGGDGDYDVRDGRRDDQYRPP